MSELIQKTDSRATIRWKLLTSTSALVLTATVSSMGIARAEDADRPLIWIELGGQMENASGQGQAFAPNFIAANPDSPVLGPTTPLQAQKWPTFTFGEEGALSYQPENSDWVFSVDARIGRSSNIRHVDHQTKSTRQELYNGVPYGPLFTQADFADTQAHHQESHAILDFTVGKDVGLGMLGKDSSSTLNVGLRIAQFTSKEDLDIRARPDLSVKYFTLYSRVLPLQYFHTYHATGSASRSFHGLGPSISWTGSAPFAGNLQDGELTFDWGADAALLFGRQKARVRHQQSSHYVTRYWALGAGYRTGYHRATPIPDRSRSITVPNAGVSVGLSWRVQDFKVSLGYRYDTFFRAMDTGIDAAKKSNVTFNGPYASISIGIGD